jgi:hypothetical protein
VVSSLARKQGARRHDERSSVRLREYPGNPRRLGGSQLYALLQPPCGCSASVSSFIAAEVDMSTDKAPEKALEEAVLTRLLNAHPHGLGSEILDNFQGEQAVFDMLEDLQARGLIQHGHVKTETTGKQSIDYPIKLSSAGVTAAQAL